MKTALYSSCFLEGLDGGDMDRQQRTYKYIEYYKKLQDKLGFNKIVLMDNGSDIQKIWGLQTLYPEVEVYRGARLEGGKFQHDYPFCWRAVWAIRQLIKDGFEKIIFIDTDGFILTSRLAEHVKNISSGWEAMWCKRHNFPESAFHILCKDAFPKFLEFTKGDYMEHNGKTMEGVLPFTKVNKDFNTDRYGELRLPQTLDMDYYGQAFKGFNPAFDLKSLEQLHS